MDATREDFVPRARSKAACCQAWAFVSFAATILCALLYIAWAVYAAFLFSESVAVFSACIVYIIFYFASPADINRRLAIWLASHSQPIWMIRVAIQWNNALVLVGVAFACCYTSPLAAFLRSAGANKYDAGGLIVIWLVLLFLLVCFKGETEGKSRGPAGHRRNRKAR